MRTGTFLGARYRRLVKRRGHMKAARKTRDLVRRLRPRGHDVTLAPTTI
ncbi:hypothetical protein AB0C76_08195 [Kitasatospora sp. NPDC048722]